MKGFRYADFWKVKIDVNRVGDTMNFDAFRICTGEECVKGWINPISDTPEIKIDSITWVKKDYFSKQWDRMMLCIPDHIKRASCSRTSKLTGQGISGTAHGIMRKMGWKGGPLITKRGDEGLMYAPEATEPHQNREGLGFTRSKKKEKKRLAAYELPNGDILYGNGDEGLIKVIELDPRGRAVVTGENVPWFSEAKEVLFWKGGIKGVAEFIFPHPKGWTFKEFRREIPLDKIQVKHTTGALAEKDVVEPTCKKAWSDVTSSWHVKATIDWDAFGSIFKSKLLTPLDFHTFFKYLVHRRLYVRSFMPEEDGYNKCRCCHAVRESQAHLHRCYVLWPIWKEFRRLVSVVWKTVSHSMELTFLGITNKGEFLPESLRGLHIIMWKMVIIEFTRTGLEAGKVFNVKSIFPMTLRRMQSRLNGVITAHVKQVKKAQRHKRTPPKADNTNTLISPLAVVEGESVTWHINWIKKCNEHGVPHNMRPKT